MLSPDDIFSLARETAQRHLLRVPPEELRDFFQNAAEGSLPETEYPALPIFFDNARGRLWLDRDYVAYQIGCGAVRYVYCNRRHIYAERIAFFYAQMPMPEDIRIAFCAAQAQMRKTKKDYYLRQT